MVDGVQEGGSVRQPLSDIQRSYKNIDNYCNNPDEGGILLFKNPVTEPQRLANNIYDEMMLTLSNIADVSVKKAEEGGFQAESYGNVVKAIETMAQTTRALADSKIPLKVDSDFVRERANFNDKVFAYNARGFHLDQTRYDWVRIFIRPEKMMVNFTPKINEIGQPGLVMKMKPSTGEPGIIRIRMFSSGGDDKIKFEIDTGVQDDLDFSEAGAGHPGHHFEAMSDLSQSDTSFDDLLGAFKDALAART